MKTVALHVFALFLSPSLVFHLSSSSCSSSSFKNTFKEQLCGYNKIGGKTQRFPIYRHTLFYWALLFGACRYCVSFTNRRSMAALHQASLSVPFFSNSVCLTLVPLSVSVIIAIFQSFSLLLRLLW